MIWFCYFSEKKKKKIVLGVAHGTSFFAQVGWKMVIYKRFYKIFSELATGFQSEFLIVFR